MKAFKRMMGRKGFTIVELLTVISVIAILISLVVPSLSQVKKIARDVQQRAQLHSISVSLEMFQNDEEHYPDSKAYASGSEDARICGAQILAEALVGRDLQGFDPISTLNPYTDNYAKSLVDAAYARGTFKDTSFARRKGPYLQLDRGGAYDLQWVYQDTSASVLAIDTNPGTANSAPVPVLTDVYRLRKSNMSYYNTTTSTTENLSIKVGAPVLYFKADTAAPDLRSIYRFDDNSEIFKIPPIKMASMKDIPEKLKSTVFHIDSAEAQTPDKAADDFYETIRNPQVSTVDRPYNQDSFILLSAGNDGIYGTSDDIWNFGK